MKLKSLLWIDFFMGFVTGIMGMTFSRSIAAFLQIPNEPVAIIAVANLLYSCLALFLARRPSSVTKFVKSLIIANWLWSAVSVVLLYLYFSNASVYGKLFLILQIIIVAGLAYLEGQALKREKNNFQKFYRG